MPSAFALLGLTAIGVSGAVGQDGAGRDGPAVVELPASVRSAALHGAGAALMGDPSAVFSNPASIATVGAAGLEFGYQRLALDSYLTGGSVALRLGQFHWAAGVQALQFGREPVVVGGVETGETFRAWEALATSGLVYRYGIIATGAALKYVRQTIGEQVDDGYAADVGLTVAVFDIMALGASVQNLGGTIGPDGRAGNLPRVTRVGFTFNYIDPQGTLRLLTTVEGLWREGRGGEFLAGLEGGLIAHGVGLEGRIGLTSEQDRSAFGRITFGGGLAVGDIKLDYAYQSFEALGSGAHRFGLRWWP